MPLPSMPPTVLALIGSLRKRLARERPAPELRDRHDLAELRRRAEEAYRVWARAWAELEAVRAALESYEEREERWQRTRAG